MRERPLRGLDGEATKGFLGRSHYVGLRERPLWGLRERPLWGLEGEVAMGA